MYILTLNGPELSLTKILIKDIVDHPEMYEVTLVAVAKELWDKLKLLTN